MSFDADVLQLWAQEPEIEIETSRGDGAPVHRTTIWIVVDGQNAYVRSVRGASGRWYRELSANSRGAIHAGGRRVAVLASPALEPETVVRVSDLLRQKYEDRWPGPTASMVRDDVLPTTMRLAPAP